MSPEDDHKPDPSYREVCTGSTGHVEVLNVEMKNPDKDFQELIKFFFMVHDPTTKNAQGNDVGTQYASVIFCSDDKQTKIATKVKEDLQKAIDNRKVTSYSKKLVETEIVPYTIFYPAHEEHQEVRIFI